MSIYHITCIDNLPSILAAGALLSTSGLMSAPGTPTSIAYGGIQTRRAHHAVPCGPGGVLHDYVPFYFCPRSPMLYAIHKGQVPGYHRGQSEIVHLRTTTQTVAGARIGFAFTDGHATMAITDYFDDLSDLAQLDWRVIPAWSWKDTPDDGDRKRRKQAEFLVHDRIPWTLIEEVGVLDQSMVVKVGTVLTGSDHVPPVNAQPRWYY